MSDQLRILLLEDQPNDAELVIRELRRAGLQFDWQRVDTEADYLAQLDPALDLILADYSLPQFTAFRALQLLLERNLDIPFIVVTGTISEEAAIDCMRLGAADYLLKDRLARLGPSVTRALERKQQRLARQQAEETLVQERSLLRSLLDNLPDRIYFKDVESRFTQVNPAHARYLGVSEPAEALGKTDSDFFSEEHALQARADEEAIIRSGEPLISKDEKETWPDGRVNWVSSTKMPLRNRAGQIVGTFGLSRDITDRKQAEEALRERETYLRAILNNSPFLIWLKDANGRFLAVNEVFARSCGASGPDEIVGKTDLDVWPRELAERYRADDREVMQQAQRKSVEEPIFDQGVITWFETSKTPIQDESGRVLGTTGFSRDITERKQADEALRTSKILLEQTIEQSPIPMVLVSMPDAIIRIANPASLSFLGIGDEPSVINTPLMDIKPSWQDFDLQGRSDAPEELPLPRSLMGIKTEGEERYIVRKDSSIRYELVNGIPIFDDAGRVIAGHLIMLDITERKQAEEALKRRATQLALLNEVGSKIVAVRELQSVLDTTARLIQETFGYHHVALFTVNRERSDATMAARAGEFVHLFPPDHRLKLGQGMVGWVGLHGEMLLANDVRAEPRYINFYPDRLPTRSELTVPIQVGQATIGMLDVQSPQVNALDENDVLVIKTLADQIAVAMENARLYETVQQELSDRKRAEEALRDSEWRNRMVTEMTTDYIFIVDVDQSRSLKLRWASDNMARLTGRTIADAATPDLWKNIVNPEDAPAFFSFIEQLLTSGEAGVLECRTTIKSGAEHWIQIAAQPHSDESGAITFIIGAIKDVSERKRAEETTRSLAKFPGEDPNPVLRLSAEGVLLYANQASQVLLREWRCAVGEPAPQMWRELCAQVLAAPARHTLDYGYGSEVYAFVIMPIVEFNYVNLYATNITVRKQAEEALHRSARRLEILHHIDRAMLTTQSPEAIAEIALLHLRDLISFQLGGVVLFEADETLVLATVPGGGPTFYTGLRLPAASSQLAALQRGQPILIPDLSVIAGESAGVPLLKAAGMQSLVSVPLLVHDQLTGTLNLAANSRSAFRPEHIDIAAEVADQIAVMLQQARLREQVQRHTAELEIRVAERTRELSLANEQLKELDRAKDQFVSNVSHELRTPLANLKLYLALLDRGKPEKRAEYMQTLQREQQRLDKMIEDLLDLSRLDLGVTPIRLIPTDLNLLLSQLIADRAALVAEHQLVLDYQPDDNLPLALIDPVMLTEVITNLVGNAINYTPSGGLISVSTTVQQRKGHDWVTFTVQDNGPGISANDLSHLFERFYRGEVGRKASAPGTGLGLAISKEIVEKMGGRITAESEPNHGATFTVWLRPAD